jgi:alanine dehydrogenase
MPALVGRTSTLGLTQATEPYVALIAQHGLGHALEHAALAAGVNTRAGRVVCAAVAQALGYS